jgi:hypothetical protein
MQLSERATIFSTVSEHAGGRLCEPLVSVRASLWYEPLSARNGDGRSHYACEPRSGLAVKAKHARPRHALPSLEPCWSHENDGTMFSDGTEPCRGHGTPGHGCVRRRGLFSELQA